MPRRQLQVFDQYRFGPRSALSKGDRFRVKGGPIYVTDDGTKIPMYERGVLRFDRYCEQGAAKWIEAFRADGGGLGRKFDAQQGCPRLAPPSLPRDPQAGRH